MSDFLNKKVSLYVGFLQFTELTDSVSTGEEHEKTHFSSRAKLFRFDGGEWRERGTGSFKVNVTEASPDKKAEHPESKKSARLLMRAEGVLHVILNLPVVKGMKVGDPSGNPPSGKQVNVIGVENGKPAIYVVRVCSPSFCVYGEDANECRCIMKSSQNKYII